MEICKEEMQIQEVSLCQNLKMNFFGVIFESEIWREVFMVNSLNIKIRYDWNLEDMVANLSFCSTPLLVLGAPIAING